MFDDLKKSLLSLVGGKSQTMRKYLGEATDDWDESKHPRGNPGNAGQFAKKGQQTQGNSENSSVKGGVKESSSGSSTQSKSHSYVTPEEDAAYKSVTDRIVAATNSGKQPDAKDLEEAFKMVRMAAAKAMPNTKVVDEDGLPLVVYHSTNRKFTTFDTPSYFAKTESDAKGIKGRSANERIVPAFLDIKSPYVIDAEGAKWTSVYVPHEGRSSLNNIVNGMRENGWKWYRDDDTVVDVDGIIVKNIREGDGGQYLTTDYIPRNPEQIKSVDPVTYDDDGNVIPLSRRFDSGNDIRGAV